MPCVLVRLQGQLVTGNGSDTAATPVREHHNETQPCSDFTEELRCYLGARVSDCMSQAGVKHRVCVSGECETRVCVSGGYETRVCVTECVSQVGVRHRVCVTQSHVSGECETQSWM